MYRTVNKLTITIVKSTEVPRISHFENLLENNSLENRIEPPSELMWSRGTKTRPVVRYNGEISSDNRVIIPRIRVPNEPNKKRLAVAGQCVVNTHASDIFIQTPIR